MDNTQPVLYMLIGVPGSGKSTWIASHDWDWNTTVIISTDDIIDRRAEQQGKTYIDVFQSEIKSATAEMENHLQQAIKANKNIIWDQTNLTPKARRGKLAKIPNYYKKVAVLFKTPSEQDLNNRLTKRATDTGKHIPRNILLGMISQLVPPSYNEGFDEIVSVAT
jgi:predicted kinase